MKHFPPSLYLKSSSWAAHPPTGIALARDLASAFEHADFVSELASLSGRSERYVAWQLTLDTIVPACLLTAALRFRKLRLGDDRVTRAKRMMFEGRASQTAR